MSKMFEFVNSFQVTCPWYSGLCVALVAPLPVVIKIRGDPFFLSRLLQGTLILSKLYHIFTWMLLFLVFNEEKFHKLYGAGTKDYFQIPEFWYISNSPVKSVEGDAYEITSIFPLLLISEVIFYFMLKKMKHSYLCYSFQNSLQMHLYLISTE